MYNDIQEYLKTCDSCQRRGNRGGTGYLNPIKVGKPFERIGIDFVGPLEKTKDGNRYILVVTDYLIKWHDAIAMKETKAENVIEFIYKQKKTNSMIILKQYYLLIEQQNIIQRKKYRSLWYMEEKQYYQ